MTVTSIMYYSGLRLDRAAAAREDPEWVAKVLSEDTTVVIPLWRDKCLVRDGLPVTMRRSDAESLLAAAESVVFLGLDDGSAVFAADVSALAQPAVPGEPTRCLLGRPAGAAPGRFSTLAGFVEIGESLEDAVRREVAEEAGVSVGRVTYQASQAWPFPAGLMVGFTAEALASTIHADNSEVLEARWFTAPELRARIADPSLGGPYRVDSIGRILIEDWLASQAQEASGRG
jgi:NADH pyrophosphatase NudC (nudix superfamily)